MIHVARNSAAARAAARLGGKVAHIDGAIGEHAHAGDIVLLVADGFSSALSDDARARELLLVFDATPTAAFVPVDVLIANAATTVALTGIEPISEAYAVLAVRALYRMGARYVVMTLGEEGTAVAVGQQITYIERPFVQTETAERTFAVVVAVGLDAGLDLLTACEQAAEIASKETEQ